ncbi:serine/threonine-protein kinase [candidate division CSSED10-310 bacterium]|uniref:Serine/threonine-protein kinase n=1 Tax=candidate division CSSED10-310 bacterium TaxID=2855610 RepID=A0ABV6YU00_UNCC1
MTTGPDEDLIEIPEQFDRYKVLDILGQGGMGRVYLAEDPVLERKIAIKVIMYNPSAHKTAWADYLQRFMVEAKASAKLNHSSIVSVYDAGDDEGMPWIAFEFVEGESLENLLSRVDTLSLVQSVSIAFSIASGLDHAHAFNIIHRDVKPANILISEDGLAKLADFGIAKAPWSGITREGMTLGSPGYMSPEQIKGLDLDGRSDLFSLAAILYEMISGIHPFKRDSMETTVLSTISGEHAPLKELIPDLPPQLDLLISKSLKANREERIGSAYEFCEILDSLDLPGLRTSSSPLLKVRQQQKGAERDPGDGIAPLKKPDVTQGKKLGLFIGIGLVTILVLTVMLGILFRVGPLSFLAAQSSGLKAGQDSLSPETRQTLQQKIDQGSLTEAMAAGRELHEAGVDWSPRRFMTEATKSLSKNDLDGVNAIAEYFFTLDAQSGYGLLIKGRIALMKEQYPDAASNFTQVLAVEGGETVLKAELNEILLGLGPKLEVDEALPALIELIATNLKAADHPQVKMWVKSTNYWLRWNAVSIRQKGNLPVDVVEVYILDLTYGDTWQIRKNAVVRLGELRDNRAVPALQKAKKKGLRDPLVANTARSVLNKVFESGD